MSSITPKDINSVSIFELSEEELRERLRPTYEAMKKEKFERGGYLTYYNPLVCPTSSHGVREYADRKELMWMDENYKEHFIKIL